MSPIKNKNRFFGIQASLPANALLSMMTLLPVSAMADVFKCKVGNSTVYQNLPCDGKAETKPHIGTSDSASPYRKGGLDTLSLAQINVAMKEENKEMREAYADRDKQLSHLSLDDYAGRASVQKEYLARFEANDRRTKELVGELRRRCPGGAMLNDSVQRCNKGK